MKKRVVAGFVLSAAMTAGGAAADEVAGTRFELGERTHAAVVRMDRGHATIVVTRAVENVGPKSDQAVFGIDLPMGAVATRLRTAGENGTWFEGELMEAEEAARKYQELTGIGGYYPKDPALLSWKSQTHLALQVFPVPARSQKTVEYTLRMPATYENGAYVMKLPVLGTEALPAKVRVVAEHPDDRVSVNGVDVAPTTTMSGELAIRLEPRGVSPIDGALASFGFATDRHLVHARISAAPKLSQTPAGAAVVVLIDTSRSMENELEPALAAARAYLSQFPGSNVEVMTFDRKVRSAFGGALPVKDALSRLYALTPQTANGSQVDDALARADAALAQSQSPTRRILLITDLRTRDALTPSIFGQKTLASGALLHIATVHPGAASVSRDDDDPWATLPRKTGGVFWRATATSPLDATGRAVFEEWVRPKRIDKLVVKGLPSDYVDASTELAEGNGIEYLGIAPSAVSTLSLEGELWSRPVKWSQAPSADENKRWAALVFGSSLLSDLSEPEQMTLAMHGRAVSPVTSYLAIEPGVRPSTEGLEESGGGGHGDGIGLGQGFGMGHGRLGSMHSSRIDRQAFLEKELATAAANCGVKNGATASVQTTLIEIVDLHVTLVTPDAKAETCVGEHMWGVMLPAVFVDEKASWSIRAR